MDIFQYTDYRSFLADYFEDRRRENSTWSLQKWSEDLKLASRSTLAMILNGQRHPGPKLVTRLTRFFSFDHRRSEYFRNLVLIQKERYHPEKKISHMEMASSLHPSGTFKLLDHQSFSAISKWYYHAIREMVRLQSFQEDPHWIVRNLNFPVTVSQARAATDDLLKLNLLRRQRGGRLVPSMGAVSSTDDVESEALKRFHEQSLANAIQAIRQIPVARRYFAGTTLTVRRCDMEQAKQAIRDFEQRFVDMFEVSEGDVIIQLNINAIPLTKYGDEETSS